MTIRHVIQPTWSSCGQACLAMLTGHDLASVFRALPDHKNGTGIDELSDYLRSHGWTTASRLMRTYGQMSRVNDLAILRMIWPHRKLGHWLVWANGCALDPFRSTYVSGTISSFLAVVPP